MGLLVSLDAKRKKADVGVIKVNMSTVSLEYHVPYGRVKLSGNDIYKGAG